MPVLTKWKKLCKIYKYRDCVHCDIVQNNYDEERDVK